MNHDTVVTYSIDDDGIWLQCTCDWRGQVEGAEFGPTPEQLLALLNRHREGIEG